MLRITFFGFLLASLVSVVLSLFGFRTIEITVLLVISSLIILEIIKLEEREEMEKTLKHELTAKLEGIEKILTYIFRKSENLLTVQHMEELDKKIHSRLEIHESSLRKKVKEELDKISQKIIEIENRLTELKNHSFSLHKRVESIENYIFEEEI